MGRIGIPADIAYGLESSVQLADITPDISMFWFRFNEAVDLTTLVDQYDDGERRGRKIADSLRRMAQINYVRPYNEWYWTQAREAERAWCLRGAVESRLFTGEFIDFLFGRYVSEQISQGHDPKRLENQRSWLHGRPEFHHIGRSLDSLAHKSREIDMSLFMESLSEPDQFQNRLKPLEEYSIISSDDRFTIKKLSNQVKRKRQRTNRKVAARSANLLTSVMGKETTKLFLGGSQVEIVGKRFTFAVRKNDMSRSDHGALTIEVRDACSNERLTNLCWYVDKTPAIDQVIAMFLAVQAGDEEEIIRVGNQLRSDNDAISRHPHVHDLIKPVVQYSPVIDLSTDEMDDSTSRYPRGTHAYMRTNADIFYSLHRLCTQRWTRGFAPNFKRAFTPIEPHEVRNITGNVVGRDLLTNTHIHEPRLLFG